MNKYTRILLTGSAVLCLAVSGCSTKGPTTSSSEIGGMKTDFGVTATEISLGVQTDVSGVFKAGGLGLTHGNQLWADRVNAKGGICGRKIKLDVSDNAYAADKAVTLYAQNKSDDLAIIQILGSSIVAALKTQMTADNMVAIPASQSDEALALPNLRMVGATYGIELINALSYIQKKGMITDGATIGHIYITGEYGDSGLAGSTYYAKLHNMKVVPVAVSSTDNDMSAAITKLKSAGVTAVLLSGAPAQLASVATSMASQGMGTLPILGNSPSFAATLVQSPAAKALGNYYRAAGLAPYDADNPLSKSIVAAYSAKYTEPPSDFIPVGYTYGLVMQAALQKACDNKDLTRKGLLNAAQSIKVDTQGLSPTLDFSKPGKPSTRETYTEQIDPNAKGGMKIVYGPAPSDEAKNYPGAKG